MPSIFPIEPMKFETAINKTNSWIGLMEENLFATFDGLYPPPYNKKYIPNTNIEPKIDMIANGTPTNAKFSLVLTVRSRHVSLKQRLRFLAETFLRK